MSTGPKSLWVNFFGGNSTPGLDLPSLTIISGAFLDGEKMEFAFLGLKSAGKSGK